MIETNIDILCPAHSAVAIGNPLIDDNIKLETRHVQDYMRRLLLALNVRASLLVNAERLELALDDAIAMMTLVPTSPLGYLCAGGIHSRRGHHASAIETLNDGLKRVPPSDPQYAHLLNARAVAYNKSIKRIDFISKLPLDVVTHNIIPRILQGRSMFHIGRPCGYFDVSRTWRKRMALASGLQYEIGPEDLFEDGYDRVKDLAPFMRSLSVIEPYKEILSKITKRHRIELSMLKKLKIIESIGRGPSLLLSSLRPLSDTLTDLVIEYGHYKDPKKRYRLCDILDACPNLASIRMNNGDIDMSAVTKTYPKLIKLELWNTDSEVKRENIPSLLQAFSQLRFLKLYPAFGSDIFSAVDQHCPLLQQLILTGPYQHFFDTLDTTARTGLRALSIPATQSADDFKEDKVVQYLMKHSETLEAFDVTAKRGFAEPKRLSQHAASQQVTFQRLRQLEYPTDAEDDLV
ncbi:hypothetical protein O0I10_006631 [Lichtheimia ornata]|uniref:Uncharacterized protein n=1 Tax=Lichtheimia ornata TaxID=688661 RepID=A0AAD7V1X0_9FUNG|nr:uncharacterized protein O0I10_006631 [Lichtheimia ornata]KAJ8657567.1 hypothetical protein O0I10_006631 [Lichtheimia ornata]